MTKTTAQVGGRGSDGAQPLSAMASYWGTKRKYFREHHRESFADGFNI